MQSARLLETSPKGWQSSGSLEDKNYSKTLESIQKLDYTAILEYHYRLLAKSEYGIDKKYTIVFDPIDNPTEKEQAEIREINSRTDAAYINAGVVSPEEVRGILRADEKSGYNALAEVMEGEPLEGEEDPFTDLLGGSSNKQNPFNVDEWKESDHPRDKDGKFSTSNSGTSSKQSKEKSPDEAKTIAGVKKGKPMSFKKANGGNVNPNYGKKPGYDTNCQTCVAVFEARLRGYDIESVPFDAHNKAMRQIGYTPWQVYKDPKTGQYPEISQINAKTYKGCEEFLKNKIKRGERYAFGYRPGLTLGKHIIVVRKGLTGKLKFYDPQSGVHLKNDSVLQDAYAWRRFGIESIHFNPITFRIDDKNLDTELLNKILYTAKETEHD